MSWNFTFSMDGSRRESDFFHSSASKLYPRYRTIKEWNYYCCKTKYRRMSVLHTGWFNSWISPFMMNNWLPEIFINVFVDFPHSHKYMLKNIFRISETIISGMYKKETSVVLLEYSLYCAVAWRFNNFIREYFLNFRILYSQNLIKIVQCNCVRNRNEEKKVCEISEEEKSVLCRH